MMRHKQPGTIIKKCPSCAQLMHVDLGVRIEVCWNCTQAVALASLDSPKEKGVQRLKREVHRSAELDFGPPVYSRRVRTAFLVAIPIAVTMLLICNSFSISIISDPAAPFASDRIPVEPSDEAVIKP
jgi:hypothetical protein